MGQLSSLIWQLSRPSAITLILPHSCLLTGIALRAWARPHSVHFMGAHLMGCTLCVDIHTHYHTGRPHSAQFMGAHFMGCTSCAWAVHTPSISWAPISWAALCAWTYIYTIIQAVHTPPSSWVPISWSAPRAWAILHDYHMPDSVAQHSMNPPYDVCSPLVCNSECMRVNSTLELAVI